MVKSRKLLSLQASIILGRPHHEKHIDSMMNILCNTLNVNDQYNSSVKEELPVIEKLFKDNMIDVDLNTYTFDKIKKFMCLSSEHNHLQTFFNTVIKLPEFPVNSEIATDIEDMRMILERIGPVQSSILEGVVEEVFGVSNHLSKDILSDYTDAIRGLMSQELMSQTHDSSPNPLYELYDPYNDDTDQIFDSLNLNTKFLYSEAARLLPLLSVYNASAAVN